MQITVKLVLLVVSAIFFLLSGLGVKSRVNFDGLGKSAFVAAFIF